MNISSIQPGVRKYAAPSRQPAAASSDTVSIGDDPASLPSMGAARRSSTTLFTAMIGLMALGAAAQAKSIDTRPGGRMGVHGMVVFGSPATGLYMSHIPMFHHPHDVQAFFKVSFPGADVFEDGTYTFQPERFALDDVIDGRLDTFKGTLFRGSFEGDGKPMRDVTVKVERVIDAAALRHDTPVPSTLEYRVIGTPQDAYVIHPITGAPDFDHLVRLDLSHSTLTAQDIAAGVRLVLPRPDKVEERITSGAVEATVKGTDRKVTIAVDRVLSTLVGPDFTDGPK